MIEQLSWLPYVVRAIFVGFPALVGVALIFAAARRWAKGRALAASGERATARVIDNQWQSWSEGRTTFRPVVTFRTTSGQEVTTVLADLDAFRSHVAGTEIEVFYDPQRPTEAAPVRRRTAGVVTSVVFGLLFLTFAVCAYEITDLILGHFRHVADFGDYGNFGDADGLGDSGW